jgi:hypothetical protein
MLSIDRISKLYRSGEVNAQELNALAQTVDMWSSPSTMNLFKTGLDDWRSRVRMSNALSDVGHVSTDKMADKQAESMRASIDRIQQSLSNLANSGLDPFGRSIRTVANIMEATGGKLASVLNGLGSLVVAGFLGVGTSRGIQTVSKAVKEADGWGNLLGGKKVVENGVQVSGGWRSAIKGGLIGMGITGAIMGAGYLYDYYREQQEARINDHNERSAGSLLMKQRDYDRQEQLLSYAQDIRTAAANGTLTEERQRDITKEINKLVLERGKGEALVREIMHGQTTELEKQLNMLKGRTAYNEQATLVTALTNYTKVFGGVGGLGKDATAAVNIQRLLIRARDLVSSGAAMPELNKLMTTPLYTTASGDVTMMDLVGRLDTNNPLGGYDYNAATMAFSGEYIAPQDGSPVSVHYIERTLGAAGLLKDPSLGFALQINGGGELGKNDKEALDLANKQAGRVAVLNMESRADSRRAQVGKDYSAWFNKNHEGFYKEVEELYKDPTMTLSTLTDSIDKQFGGGVGEALAKKGGPLAMQPILDRIIADKALLGGVAKTNISPSDGAGIAEYYFNNRFAMKSLPESSRHTLADYLLASRAGAMGPAPSNMNLGSDASMPKMLADLYLKAHSDKRTAISLASTSWLSELQGMFDTKQGFKIEGKFMPIDAMEKEDTTRLATWYSQQLSKVLPGGRKTLDDKYREEREKLKERYRNVHAIHELLPVLARQENRDLHSRIVENLTAMDKDYYADKYSEYLSSSDPSVAQFAGIMMDYQIAASKEAKAKLPEALAAFGGDKEQERIAGRYYTAAKENIAIKAKAASYSQHAALADWEQFVSEAQKPALSLFAGERETNASITDEINKQLQRNQELYKDEHAALTDRLNIMRQSVALEKQKVELDMQVIRARKAAAVGMEAQGQFVDILTDISGAGTLNRMNNLRNLGMGLVNRGLGDSVRRALGDMHNPLASIASFIYDPTGSMDVKYAQERLTNATLSLADKITELTATLRANSDTIDKLYNNGMAEAGGSAGGVNGASSAGGPSPTAAKAALGALASGKSAFANSGSSSVSPSFAISSALSGGSIGSIASILGGNGDISAAFTRNPDGVTDALLNIGIKPTNGTKFTPEELAKRKDEIAKKQAVAQQRARNNPFAGMFGGGVSFGASFYEVGGRGRGGIVVDSTGKAVLDAHGNNTYGGWGATQNQYDANGKLTQQGQGGLSTTGAVVGSAQALMAGFSAWEANRENGAGAQDKAAAGSALMSGGAVVGMIPGGGWVAGSIMMGVGAILNIMAGAAASEHAAKKKDEAFQKQLDELQRTIAIQEEQKKAIGLMAERVLSMRGDVGNTFEGIASSAFLSGRWAGRAIQVQHLTVVANNPTELSQALTTALTTQSRQGA